jgi:hypothetical protein
LTALEINKNATHEAPGSGVIKSINRENILQAVKTLSLSQQRKFTRFTEQIEYNGIIGFSHIIEQPEYRGIFSTRNFLLSNITEVCISTQAETINISRGRNCSKSQW